MISFKSYLRDCDSALSAWSFRQRQVKANTEKKLYAKYRKIRKKGALKNYKNISGTQEFSKEFKYK